MRRFGSVASLRRCGFSVEVFEGSEVFRGNGSAAVEEERLQCSSTVDGHETVRLCWKFVLDSAESREAVGASVGELHRWAIRVVD